MSDVPSTDKVFHERPPAPCEFAGRLELADKENHRWQWVPGKDPWLSIGRICKLDHVYCANWEKSELVARCPTLNDPHYNKELRR